MRRRTRTTRSNRRQRTKLGLPDLEHVKSAVLVSLRSPESQRSYRRSIDDFVYWYCSEPRLSFNKTVVTRYRIYLEDRLLAPGTINVNGYSLIQWKPRVFSKNLGSGMWCSL